MRSILYQISWTTVARETKVQNSIQTNITSPTKHCRACQWIRLDTNLSEIFKQSCQASHLSQTEETNKQTTKSFIKEGRSQVTQRLTDKNLQKVENILQFLSQIWIHKHQQQISDEQVSHTPRLHKIIWSSSSQTQG